MSTKPVKGKGVSKKQKTSEISPTGLELANLVPAGQAPGIPAPVVVSNEGASLDPSSSSPHTPEVTLGDPEDSGDSEGGEDMEDDTSESSKQTPTPSTSTTPAPNGKQTPGAQAKGEDTEKVSKTTSAIFNFLFAELEGDLPYTHKEILGIEFVNVLFNDRYGQDGDANKLKRMQAQLTKMSAALKTGNVFENHYTPNPEIVVTNAKDMSKQLSTWLIKKRTSAPVTVTYLAESDTYEILSNSTLKVLEKDNPGSLTDNHKDGGLYIPSPMAPLKDSVMTAHANSCQNRQVLVSKLEHQDMESRVKALYLQSTEKDPLLSKIWRAVAKARVDRIKVILPAALPQPTKDSIQSLLSLRKHAYTGLARIPCNDSASEKDATKGDGAAGVAPDTPQQGPLVPKNLVLDRGDAARTVLDSDSTEPVTLNPAAKSGYLSMETLLTNAPTGNIYINDYFPIPTTTQQKLLDLLNAERINSLGPLVYNFIAAVMSKSATSEALREAIPRLYVKIPFPTAEDHVLYSIALKTRYQPMITMVEGTIYLSYELLHSGCKIENKDHHNMVRWNDDSKNILSELMQDLSTLDYTPRDYTLTYEITSPYTRAFDTPTNAKDTFEQMRKQSKRLLDMATYKVSKQPKGYVEEDF